MVTEQLKQLNYYGERMRDIILTSVADDELALEIALKLQEQRFVISTDLGGPFDNVPSSR